MPFMKTIDDAIYKAKPIPKCYGIAYRDFAGCRIVCYPVPLNLIVRLAREIWQRLAIPGLSRQEDQEIRAYNKGIADGEKLAYPDAYKAGWEAAFNELEKTIGQGETN